jgi:hypothetical protein
MTTATTTLTDFLLARVAEDEAEIGVLGPYQHDDSAGPNGVGWGEVGAISEVLMISHARVLAECEAKRRIVEWAGRHAHAADEKDPDPATRSFNAGAAWASYNIVRTLAAVYSDHPDYRSEWRP